MYIYIYVYVYIYIYILYVCVHIATPRLICTQNVRVYIDGLTECMCLDMYVSYVCIMDMYIRYIYISCAYIHIYHWTVNR